MKMNWKDMLKIFVLILTGMVIVILIQGCQPLTQQYQRAVYGEPLQVGTPCRQSERWDGHVCHPRVGS